MNFTEIFRDEIKRRYPVDHAILWGDIEERYRDISRDVAFAATSSNSMDKRLDFCGLFLATIQILERRGEDFEEIRATCLAITIEYVRPKSSFARWVKSLPAKLMGTPLTYFAARFMAKKTGRLGHPDGFLVQIVTAKAETHGLGFGFDILECGICKLFDKHGARRYVPILCEVDELTSAMAGLELIRSGTIAGGRSKCDFRFRVH